MLAWNLYCEATYPGAVGHVLWELRTLRLTEREAGELATRIAHLAGVQQEIERDRRKAEEARQGQQ